MKKLYLPFSILSILTGGAAAAHKTAPASFAGTKWNQITSYLGEYNTLVFVDETTCIYTFFGEPETHDYTVTGDTIKFAGDTYTIRKQGEIINSKLYTGCLKNDILMIHGAPYWIKE